MKKLSILFILQMLLHVGICNADKHNPEAPKFIPENETEKHEKPSNKDIILMVMQNSDVLLSVDSSCHGVGSGFDDKTIGQYLSGFWQYHTDSKAKNSLKISVVEGKDIHIKEKHWKATFMINGQMQHENWSWGVSFYIIAKNWLVVKDSFKCLGAG